MLRLRLATPLALCVGPLCLGCSADKASPVPCPVLLAADSSAADTASVDADASAVPDSDAGGLFDAAIPESAIPDAPVPDASDTDSPVNDAGVIDLKAYWPAPSAGKAVLKVFGATTDAGVYPWHLMKHVADPDEGAFGLQDHRFDLYESRVWLDTWRYRIVSQGSAQGVFEFEDILHMAAAADGTMVTYEPPLRLPGKQGHQIFWGDTASVGQVIDGDIQIDYEALGRPMMPQDLGYNSLTIVQWLPTWQTGTMTFHDVVVAQLSQVFCTDYACTASSGADGGPGYQSWTPRYHLAPGVGIIDIEYAPPSGAHDVLLRWCEVDEPQYPVWDCPQ